MAKTNKRQRKKNAKTKARKGLLYQPRSTYRNIEIKSVDINPNNKYHQELLSVAQFNLLQLDKYVRNKIELNTVDIDTLKWLAGNQFLRIIDDIRNWARYDPNYYKNENNGVILNIISKVVSRRLDKVNGMSGSRIVKAFNKAHRQLKEDLDKYTKGKKPKGNSFVIVYYEDVDLY